MRAQNNILNLNNNFLSQYSYFISVTSVVILLQDPHLAANKLQADL